MSRICDNSRCANTAVGKSFIYHTCSKKCLNAIWSELPKPIKAHIQFISTKRKKPEPAEETMHALESVLLYYFKYQPTLADRILHYLSVEEVENLSLLGSEELDTILSSPAYSAYFYNLLTYTEYRSADKWLRLYLRGDSDPYTKERMIAYAYKLFQLNTQVHRVQERIEAIPTRFSIAVTYTSPEGIPSLPHRVMGNIHFYLRCAITAVHIEHIPADWQNFFSVIHQINFQYRATSFLHGLSRSN